ncbi:hypothetical protein D3C78_1518300 [compost metagenome]
MFEYLRMIQFEERLQQQAAPAARQQQRFAVEALGDVQLAAQQGLLGQARIADQALFPGHVG